MDNGISGDANLCARRNFTGFGNNKEDRQKREQATFDGLQFDLHLVTFQRLYPNHEGHTCLLFFRIDPARSLSKPNRTLENRHCLPLQGNKRRSRFIWTSFDRTSFVAFSELTCYFFCRTWRKSAKVFLYSCETPSFLFSRSNAAIARAR